jgi:serine phosphatase RsbU (regulator of sigma subunit)
MRCAFSSITCPADNDNPGHRGGDIVAAVETPAAVRLLVGDVMGHGQEARKIAARVTDAFIQLAAHGQDPPQVVAARLDQVVAAQDGREEFVTAQFIDIPRGPVASEPSVVCCGHPPPLVLRGGSATFLDAIPPAPPLGLLDLAGAACPLRSPLRVLPGETILFYTDGVTEARDRAGVFYPLPARASAIASELAPEPAVGALAGKLADDLLDYVGGPLRDDATLLCLRLAAEASADARTEASAIAAAAE